MKKNLLVIMLLVALLFIVGKTDKISAEETRQDLVVERSNKAGKTLFVHKGINLYVSASLNLNYKDGKVYNSNNEYQFPGRESVVGDVKVSYDEGTGIFDVVLKRSAINAAINDTDTNVYGLININFDIHDFDNIKYTIRKYSETGYDVSFLRNYGTYAEKGYIELFGSAIEFAGVIRPYVATNTSTFYIFNDDQLTSLPNPADIDTSKLDLSKAIYSYQPKVRININEDVKIDLKNIEKSVSISGSQDPTKPAENSQSATDLLKENSKIVTEKYSWTLLGDEGAQIDFKTGIKFDDSPKKQEILSKVTGESIGNIKFITFEHHGKLKTKAKVKIYVGDTFKKDETIKLYYYNDIKDQLEYIDQKIIVDKEGYAEFIIEHCSDYVLVNSKISVNEKPLSSNVYYYLAGASILILLGIGVAEIIILKKKKARSN